MPCQVRSAAAARPTHLKERPRETYRPSPLSSMDSISRKVCAGEEEGKKRSYKGLCRGRGRRRGRRRRREEVTPRGVVDLGGS